MTKGEINLLYAEVEKLLSEICSFLKEEITGGFISHSGRSVANKLIEKSKKQLQIISVITTADNADCTSESYVDMHNYKADQELEEPQEVYSDVSLFEEGSTASAVNGEYIACPYANLPAVELREGKTGHIYRKERIFFFGQQKKVYAAVQQSWFLIYMNENSVKPCQTFDLTRYEAKPASTHLKDMKKRDESFDLASFIDAKTYHFIALTAKDMLQWVAAINKQSEKSVSKRSLPPVPAANPITLENSLSGSTESMNDYEPLTKYQIKQQKIDEKSPEIENHKTVEKPSVPLPPRNTPLRTSQRPIPRIPSNESVGSQYDVVGPGVVNLSNSATPSSFSDDDSDTVYDNPTDIKKEDQLLNSAQNNLHSNITTNNGNSVNNQDYDEDEIYDYLEKPKLVTEPNSTDFLNSQPSNTQTFDVKKQKESELGKSKPSLKPKILSLRRRRKDP